MSMKKKKSTRIEIPKRLDAYLADGPVADWVHGIFTYIGSLGVVGAIMAWHFIGFNAWYMPLLILGVGVSAFFLSAVAVPFATYDVRKRELIQQIKRPNDRKRDMIPPGSKRQYTLASMKEALETNGEWVNEPTHAELQASADAVTDFVNLAGSIYINLDNEPDVRENAYTKICDAVDLFEKTTGTDVGEWIRVAEGPESCITFESNETMSIPLTLTAVSRIDGTIAEFDIVPNWANGKIRPAAEILEIVNAQKHPEDVLFLARRCNFTESDGTSYVHPVSSYYILHEQVDSNS